MFEIFVQLSAGDGEIGVRSDVPIQHLLQHVPHQGIVGGHGERQLIPCDPLCHIAQTPEKFIAAPGKPPLRGLLDVKILIGGGRKLRQAPDFIQKREEELVAVAAALHDWEQLDPDVDAVSVVKQQQPGVALLISFLDMESLPISECGVLLLHERHGPKPAQPAGVLDEAAGFRYHVHHVKIPVAVPGGLGVGPRPFQISRQDPVI